MIDLYLRAGNAGALANACPFLRGEDPETKERFWISNGEGFALDVIGSITITSGTYSEEGNELTPSVMDDRFHVNLRCTDAIAALVPDTVRVNPKNPTRVWA